MNALIIFTHPKRDSLNGSFLEKTVEGLEENESIESIEVLDLYREGFDPVLIFNQKKRRRDMHKDPDLQIYREQINRADIIIFIYPIWWGRPPAMLLGYIDKVFASNYAYKFEKNKLLPKGLITNKKVFCISTMDGPTGYLKLFRGNVHKVLMRDILLKFIGLKRIKIFEFGNMEKKDGSQSKKILKIRKLMSTI